MSCCYCRYVQGSVTLDGLLVAADGFAWLHMDRVSLGPAHARPGWSEGRPDVIKTGQTEAAAALAEPKLSTSHFVNIDRALDRPAYDSGTHKNQFTAATDLIYHF